MAGWRAFLLIGAVTATGAIIAAPRAPAANPPSEANLAACPPQTRATTGLTDRPERRVATLRAPGVTLPSCHPGR